MAEVTPARKSLEDASVYVEQHKIFQLFEGLLQELLVSKPEDPLDQMIKLLKREPVPRVVVAGPPGAQARSVCELLAVKKGVVHVIASEVWRELEKVGSESGKEAKKLIDNGLEVPDTLLLTMLKEKLTSGACVTSGWVLEGFPSTAAQARDMLTAGLLPTRFLHIALSDSEVMRRLTGRRVDPQDKAGGVYHLEDAPPPNAEVAARLEQRAEDTPERVRERLSAYRQAMAPVLPSFSKVMAELDAAKFRSMDGLIEAALPHISAEMPTRAPRGAARVLLLGGPGSKSEEVGMALAQRYGAKLVSAIDVLHAAALANNAKAKSAMKDPFPLHAGEAVLSSLITARLAQEDVRTAGFVLVGFPNTKKQAESLLKATVWIRDVVHLELPPKVALAAVTGKRYDPYDGEIYHMDNLPADKDLQARLTAHPQDAEPIVKQAIGRWSKDSPSLLKLYAAEPTVTLRTEDAKRTERELVERLAPCFLSL